MVSILPTDTEQKSLVEVARSKGYDVVEFLDKVVRDQWTDLGLDKAIALPVRLAAAELLRKYAALPTNVALEMAVTTKLEYVGDRDVEPVVPALAPRTS